MNNKNRNKGIIVILIALLGLILGRFNPFAQTAIWLVAVIVLAAYGLYVLMRKI